MISFFKKEKPMKDELLKLIQDECVKKDIDLSKITLTGRGLFLICDVLGHMLAKESFQSIGGHINEAPIIAAYTVFNKQTRGFLVEKSIKGSLQAGDRCILIGGIASEELSWSAYTVREFGCKVVKAISVIGDEVTAKNFEAYKLPLEYIFDKKAFKIEEKKLKKG